MQQSERLSGRPLSFGKGVPQVKKTDLYERNGVWQIRYRVNGVQQRRSTGEVDYAKAVACLTKFKLDQEKGDVVVEDLAARALKLEVQPSADRMRYLNLHLIPFFKNKPVREITPRDVVEYKEWREQPRPKAKTGTAKNPKLFIATKGQIEKELNFLYGTLLPPMDINGEKFVRPKFDYWRNPGKDYSTYLELDQLHSIFKQYTDSDYCGLAKVAAFTGFRFGDLQTLTWNEIDFSLNLIKRRTNKSGAMVNTYIVRPVLEVLLKRKQLHAGPGTDFVFDFLPRNHKVAKQLNLRTWNRACKLAGLTYFPETLSWKQPLKIRFHDLRHFFGSYLRQQGESLDMIKDLMGHSKISTTQRYAKVSDENKQRALSVFDRVAEHKPSTVDLEKIEGSVNY